MKVLLTFFTLCLLSFSTYAIEATHGMVLFGQQKLMAYHLPMFHKIHAKQVVLQYTLPDEVKEKLLSYGNNLLTFVPAPFDMDKFLEKPFPLAGDVYLGHFEKDGVVVMSDVTMDSIQVLYKSDIVKDTNAMDTYKLFGTPFDLYEVHLIQGGKEFDHIIKANIDTNSQETVALAQTVLDDGYTISNVDLLKEGQGSIMSIPKGSPDNCHLRWCGTLYDHLNVLAGKTYFLDSVM